MNFSALLVNSVTAVVLDLLIKTSILLGLAIIATALLRKSSAAVRHRVWCVTFLGLLLLPGLSYVLPAWQIPILPPAPATNLTDAVALNAVEEEAPASQASPAANEDPGAYVDRDSRPQAESSLPFNEQQEFPLSGDIAVSAPSFDDGTQGIPLDPVREEPSLPPTAESSPAEIDAQQSRTTSTTIRASTTSVMWAAKFVLTAIWLVGALSFAAPLLLGLLRNMRAGKQAQEIVAPELQSMSNAARRDLRIRHSVRFVQSTDASIPQTWGLFKPVILLPEQWPSWSAARIRLVLLHELAHIKRHDVAIQVVSRLVASLLWFQPLCWYAMRRLRIESELACDDCVLLAGESPHDYATELVEIARGANRFALPSAVAMAQTTRLEQRVLALLDKARRRMPLGRNVARLLLFVGLAIAIATSAARPVAREAQADDVSEPAPSDIAAIDPSESEVQSQNNAGVSSPPEGVRRCQGVVLDPAGNPVAGAQVRLKTKADIYPVEDAWMRFRGARFPLHSVTLAETTSDAQGRFVLDDPEAERNRQDAAVELVTETWKHTAIVAELDGFLPGFVGKDRMQVAPADDHVVRLRNKAEASSIHGRIVNLEGQGVADATVKVAYVASAKPGEVDRWLQDVERLTQQGVLPLPSWSPSGYPDSPDTAASRYPVSQVTAGEFLHFTSLHSNGDGEFQFDGLSQDQLVVLKVESDGHATQFVNVLVRETPTIRARNAERSVPNMFSVMSHDYHGREFTVVALQAEEITGTFRDKDTGEPLAGVLVTHTRMGTYAMDITDAQGKFRFSAKFPSDEVTFEYEIPPALPYFQHYARVPRPDPGESVDYDAYLQRATWLTGRVINKVTGHGVPDVQVGYTPYRDNPHLEEYEPFDLTDPNAQRHTTQGSKVVTDSDGKFRVRAIPGQGVLAAMCYEPTFCVADRVEEFADRETSPVVDYVTPEACALNPVDIEIGAIEKRIDLSVDPGQSVTLLIQDENGNELTGYCTSGHWHRPSKVPNVPQDEALHFVINGIDKDEARTVLVMHREKQLGIAQEIRAVPGETSPRPIRLQPLAVIKGRISFPGEDLLGDIRIECQMPNKYGNSEQGEAFTDTDGNFVLDPVIPGATYTIRVARLSNRKIRPASYFLCESIVPQPGEVIDLGEIDLSSKARPDVKRTPRRDIVQKHARGASAISIDQQPTDARHFTGKVVTANGKPIAGARVQCLWEVQQRKSAEDWKWGAQARAPREVIQRCEATTDRDGRFEMLDQPVSWADVWEKRTASHSVYEKVVLVTADGYLPGWVSEKEILAGEETEIRLAAAQPVAMRSQLLDLEGQPVAGATITPLRVATANGDEIPQWLADVERLTAAGELPAPVNEPHAQYPQPPDYVASQFPARNIIVGSMLGLEPTKSNEQGEFSFAGLGEDQLVVLRIDAAGCATTYVNLVTKDMPVIHARGAVSYMNGGSLHLYLTNDYHGRDSTIVISPSQLVEGTIRDADTGDPIPGVLVTDVSGGGTGASARTDADGHYRIEGLKPGHTHSVHVSPRNDQPYFDQRFDVPKVAGVEPVQLDLDLKPGVWITGKVRNKQTGEAIPNVLLNYTAFRDNPFAQDYERFLKFNANMLYHNSRHPSDSAGNYRALAIPGRGVLMAFTFEEGYRAGVGGDLIDELSLDRRSDDVTFDIVSLNIVNSVYEVDVAESVKELPLDVTLDPGVKVTLHVHDEDGSPLSGYFVGGEARSHYSTPDKKVSSATVDIIALGPNEKRLVALKHVEKQLGLLTPITPRGYEDSHQDVTLLPMATVTGRLINDASAPIVGARVQFLLQGQPWGFSRTLDDDVFTDEDGRFTHTSLPGATFLVHAQGPGMRYVTLHGSLKPKPGELIDLGEIDVTRDKRPEVKRTPRGKAANNESAARSSRVGETDSGTMNEVVESAGSESPEKQTLDSSSQDSAEDKRIWTGKVIDPDGAPVAGARVRYLKSFHTVAIEEAWILRNSHLGWPELIDAESEAITDENGRFQLRRDAWKTWNEKNKTAGQTTLTSSQVVIASKEGYAPAWASPVEVFHFSPDKPLQLRRLGTSSIQGELLDLEGKPIRGATIHVEYVVNADAERIAQWLADVPRMAASGQLPHELSAANMNAPDAPNIEAARFPGIGVAAVGEMLEIPDATSDEHGKFEIPDLQSNNLVILRITCPGYATQIVNVVTRVMDTVRAWSPNNNKHRLFATLNLQNEYHGARSTYILSPSQPIVGTIRDIDTGRPIVGAWVSNAMSFSRRQIVEVCETDENGEFRLDELLPGSVNRLRVNMTPRMPYFNDWIDIEEAPDVQPIQVEITLKAGVWIEGKVINKSTGKGEADVRMGYTPYLDNPFATRYDAFNPRRIGVVSNVERFMTNEDGEYRVLGIPGRGVVAARSSQGTFRTGTGIDEIPGVSQAMNTESRVTFDIIPRDYIHAAKLVECEENASVASVDFELDPGLTHTLNIQDQNGDPVAGFIVGGFDNPHQAPRLPIRTASTVDILGLTTGKDRDVLVLQTELGLGAATTINVTEDSKVESTLRLSPVAQLDAQLVNDKGSPVPNARVRIDIYDGDDFQGTQAEVDSDDKGHVRYKGLIPGVSYRVILPNHAWLKLLDGYTPESGEKIELGEVEVAED